MRTLISPIISLLILYGCQPEVQVEQVFNETPAQRLNITLEQYTTTLSSSQHGWLMKYQPDSLTGYFNIHLSFSQDGNATITSDFNRGEFDLPTTFRVGYAQNPELIFENFTVFHTIVDALGQLKGEFQFTLHGTADNGDTLFLKSKTDIGDYVTHTKLIKAVATTKQDIIRSRGAIEQIDANLTHTDKIFTDLIVYDPETNRQFTANIRVDFTARVMRLTYPERDTIFSYTNADGNTFSLPPKDYRKFLDNRPEQRATIIQQTDTSFTDDPIVRIIPIDASPNKLRLIEGFTVPNTDIVITTFEYDQASKAYISKDAKDKYPKYELTIQNTSTTSYAYFPFSNAFGDPSQLGGSNYYAYFSKSGADSLRHLSLTSDNFRFLEGDGVFDRFDIVFGQSVPIPNPETKEVTNQIVNYIAFSRNNQPRTNTVYVFFDIKRIANQSFHFVDRGLVAGNAAPYTAMMRVLFSKHGFYVEPTNESNISGSPSFSLTSASNSSFRFSVFAVGQ